MSTLKIKRFSSVPGEFYGTPKEVWGFLVKPSARSAGRAAIDVLRANAAMFKLSDDLDLQLRAIKRGIGGSHAIFSQHHKQRRVHRGYVTVHLNSRNEVYLIKNRAVPSAILSDKPAAKKLDLYTARREALRAAARTRRGVVLEEDLIWYPVKDTLRPAYKFRIACLKPREEWLIYIDANNGNVLSKYDNLAHATGIARIFDPNPVVTLKDWKQLLERKKPIRRIPDDLYRTVKLRNIAESGLLNGRYVSTRLTKNRIRRPSLDFTMNSHERGFEEVMAYYHVDAAVQFVRSLGYIGSRAIFKKPIPVNARATKDDQSWYSPGLGSLSFGTGAVDDAEDAETILHEFGHALQDAICPDFGQSTEAAAIGEGFGDYIAASFFAGHKTSRGAKRFLPTVMSWDGLVFGDPRGKNGPPCLRRVDGRLTYDDFDHSRNAEEHENGEIWSATLWDIWCSVGRDVADKIIIDSHFELDGFTTFAKAARAIIHADKNLFGGRHNSELTAILKRRKIDITR